MNRHYNTLETSRSRKVSAYEKEDPRNAVILAAGFGMRMVPINLECPKALIEVRGEVLIERTIKQLHDAGIDEIYVVSGFLKENMKYLEDEYNVRMIENDEFSVRNNLHSLRLAADKISNTYVIPCDIWCRKNPYRGREQQSWYSDMTGIAYLTGEQGKMVAQRLREYDSSGKYDDKYWEETLFDDGRMIVSEKTVNSDDFVEINTYEQLRDFDSDSCHLRSDAIDVITSALGVTETEITEITVLKKGMTNRSFLFSCAGSKYIMRIPGEGTDQLINRKQEAQVYNTIDGRNICDDIAYINPENGYKITKFLEGARVCDPENRDDLIKCMKKLREFHGLKLEVEHEFDIFGQMEFYESLWNGVPSAYSDYSKTKEKVLELKKYIDGLKKERCLTHIDAVPDNFLFVKGEDGKEEIRLIDWEYSGMQDPHVDVAMFCIYSLYEKEQADALIDIYFENRCTDELRAKIYCYIASCGLLWSNWCEYKRALGVDFGEYSLRQYRYAGEFYDHAMSLIKKEGDEKSE